jgi:16S rRNA (adenine1518-N6/adenine1519-N6)-dimethyltransferase
MILLVQREVALRVVGRHGDWSTLTVAAHLFAEPRLLRTVEAASFTPVPRVDSALLGLDVLPRPALAVAPRPFLRFVETVFRHRRKQLHNSLGSALGVAPETVAQVLAGAAIEPSARPQTLDLEAWGRLYEEAQRRRPASSL